ncbi:LLM class flavin-dependent oxidoreductase [Brevibacillus reuszeri]|uniref:LLM class flavin-dependent oxidoreductase n=1 Tax=Brevibacillus reuszeri TaxID=54915 RepID=UPI000CCC52BB|nr:LLM class flavin-dependent oxidoreductase [Brevibacillus reuszeri]
MQLSILDLSPIYEGVSPLVALQQSVKLAQTAESLGYSRFWVSEHHDMPQFASSSPEVLLAHIGAQTTRIRLGSGAVLLPNYKPYKVAEAFSLLATLHPGRIDLGIGRAPGGSAHASMALCDRFLEQVSRMPELLRDLSALLENEFTIEGQPVFARPIPPAPPALWLLGTNKKSAEFAAMYGTGYVFGHFMSEHDGEEAIALYRQAFQPVRMRQEPAVIVAVSVICADSMEEAQELAERGRARSFRERVIGDPDHVSAVLKKMAKKYQACEFMILTDIPDYQKRIRSYELLAQSMIASGANVLDRT